jgi:peptidoglycan/LPS O-acetylase OafA/YrhL
VYGVFLVHPILIEVRAFGGNSYGAFSEISFVLESAGFMLLSFVVSAFFYLLVEGPLYQIRQMLR